MTRLKNLYSNAAGSLMQSLVIRLQHSPLLEGTTIPFYQRELLCMYSTCDTDLSLLCKDNWFVIQKNLTCNTPPKQVKAASFIRKYGVKNKKRS